MNIILVGVNCEHSCRSNNASHYSPSDHGANDGLYDTNNHVRGFPVCSARLKNCSIRPSVSEPSATRTREGPSQLIQQQPSAQQKRLYSLSLSFSPAAFQTQDRGWVDGRRVLQLLPGVHWHIHVHQQVPLVLYTVCRKFFLLYCLYSSKYLAVPSDSHRCSHIMPIGLVPNPACGSLKRGKKARTPQRKSRIWKEKKKEKENTATNQEKTRQSAKKLTSTEEKGCKHTIGWQALPCKNRNTAGSQWLAGLRQRA